MSVSSKTRKMLWGRAANRCAICRRELFMDETETDDASVIGDECHIVAREQDGPRGDSELTSEQRDLYNNLVLMCKIHHKQIDDQPGHFTVELLHQMKSEHIQWVNSSLNIDRAKQRDDEVVLTYIDKWSDLTRVNEWESWISSLLSSGQPSLSKEQDMFLKELIQYLFTRIYPDRYPELRRSLENFRYVLNDFINTFHRHSEEQFDRFITSKFYRYADGYGDERRRLEWEFDFHVDLVEDLALELTRAGNYVCDMVRAHVLPTYRLAEGLLTVVSGPHMDFSFNTYRPQYRLEEKANLYPGLQEFKRIRTDRTNVFGAGVDINDPLFIERQKSMGN